MHAPGEVEKFYRRFAAPALIGMESTGNCQWFVELAEKLGHEVWIGDAAKIRASEVRQQKHDRRDAALLVAAVAAKDAFRGSGRRRANRRICGSC